MLVAVIASAICSESTSMKPKPRPSMIRALLAPNFSKWPRKSVVERVYGRLPTNRVFVAILCVFRPKGVLWVCRVQKGEVVNLNQPEANTKKETEALWT